MKLPYAEAAIVDMNKLSGYCLNPNHSRGKHKARLFTAILGLTADDATELQSILLKAALDYEATLEKQDLYGQHYVIDFSLTRNDQTATIRSAWIIRPTETFPRLTSCYIIR
jgi:hypothetical protein